MDTESSSLIISWLPFIVLIVVVFFVFRWSTAKQSSAMSQLTAFYEAQIAEMKRTNVALERIASNLEKRANS